MKDELTESQTAAVLKSLDEALDKGPWDDSNFLRVIGKKLQEIRDSLADLMAINEKNALNNASGKQSGSIENNQQEVYVALYSTEGKLLQSWERIIANLQRQIISRPIYAKVEDVEYLIKAKENKMNEAYVAIIVHKEDILTMSPDKIPMDRFGKPLMSLKDKSLNLDNITRFVHVSGIYQYSKTRLIKN